MSFDQSFDLVKVKIKFQDDLYYATNNELGLNIVSKDIKKIIADVPKVLEDLYLMNKGIEIKAVPETDTVKKYLSKSKKQTAVDVPSHWFNFGAFTQTCVNA